MASNFDNNIPGSNNSSSNGAYRGQYNGTPGPGKPSDQDPDEIDLKRLFYTLWHHKWLIIGTVLVFSILAGVIAYTETPIYKSEGTLMIAQQQNRYSMAGSDLANLLSSTYGIGTGSTISNELQVLRSRRLSREMADTLMKTRLMRNGRQYPALFKSYPDDSSLAAPDTVAIRIRNNINFSQVDREADVVSIAYESPSPVEAADMINLSMEVYSGISTRQNRRSASSAVNFLQSERKRIQKRLARAEDSLRRFMNNHKLVEVDTQTQELIKRMADLESKKQEARTKLVAVNAGIKQYKDRLNKIKPGLADQYADAIGPNMMRLQYKLAELKIEKTQLLANNPSLKNNPNPPQKLTKLNNKIDIYKNQIRDMTENLIKQGDQYLGFLGGSDGNVAQAVTDLNKKLIDLQVQKQQYSSQVKVINGQLTQQRKFFDNLPDNMIKLARLKRDVKIDEQLFMTVSQQDAEMSLWKQTQFGLGRPIDKGYVPENPVKPNKKLYVLVGFILGGILSVGYIFVNEAFNTKIDGVAKIKEFEYPLLSVVPNMDDYVEKNHQGREKVNVQGTEVSTSMVSILDTVSPISESFRRLQSNIIYSNPDQELNTLMVTSSTKGEGKTTIVSNLGVVLAEAGYKVLIVDADLRRPNLHNLFGLGRAPGITEVLFENVGLDEAVKPTVMSNLSVLTAGNRPPNPSAVTQSKAFLNTLEELEEAYDFVLLDTPPYGIITDASAMIKRTDGVVVVTRFNKTTEAELTHVFSNLHQVNANVIGTVLTSFNYNKTSDYYYSAYYYREFYHDYDSYHKS